MKKWLVVLVILMSCCTFLSAAELKVGVAKADITPEKSVPLWGQFNFRPSDGVLSPITVNVCAVEAFENGKSIDSAIMVSVDVVGVPTDFAKMAREKAVAQDPTITPEKIVMFAIHTHTAPTIYNGPELPKWENLENYPETIDHMTTKIANAIVAAWQNKVDADFSWGIEQVVIGQSRRACYFDGRAVMYGDPNDPNFSHYENPTDPDLGTFFFWNKEGKLLSVVVNVCCTAQVLEHLTQICSDYWAPTREKLYERFGEDLVVVASIGPAGDDSPHPQYRKEALARMRKLRGNLSEIDEIARRIDRAVADSYECAVQDKQSDIVFGHKTETLQLPLRRVTDEEYEECKAKKIEFQQTLDANQDKTPAEVAFMGINWYGEVVQNYEDQHAGIENTLPSDIHIVRFGDVSMATNSFELFADYGMRIKVRSPSVMTMVVELADGDGAYMPTAKAIQGGGYSAVIQSGPVGPEGGQILVNETLRLLDELW